MKVKSDTEYIVKTGHSTDIEGNIPMEIVKELVRCKDCIHYDDSINGEASCFISGYPLEDPNGFCSAGTDKI